jgi:hypothetical protein
LLIVGGGWLFCVANPPDEHVPCPDTPPSGSPTELLNGAGGFSIPASQLRANHPGFL